MKFNYHGIASVSKGVGLFRRPFVLCPLGTAHCLAERRIVSTTFGDRTVQPLTSSYGGRLLFRVVSDMTPCRHYSSGGDRPPPQPQTMDDDRSQNIFQRFKNMAKKYWYIVLPVHLVTSTVWFGSFYFLASSGVDIPALLETFGLPEWVINKVKDGNSWTSYLVIAYGLYKIFTPFRYMVTLGGTGMTIRCLQRLGYAIGYPKKP